MTDPAIIEAAARAVSAAYLKEITWEDQEEIGRTFYRNLAKVVLTAVTPRIEAAALERAAKEAEDCETGEDAAHDIRALKSGPAGTDMTEAQKRHTG